MQKEAVFKTYLTIKNCHKAFRKKILTFLTTNSVGLPGERKKRLNEDDNEIRILISSVTFD